MTNVCVPGYKLPTRKYFSNTLLPALYEETKTNLKTDLETQALSVCLAVDSWTSPTNDSYNAFTAHYINDEFELKGLLLECYEFKESHTFQNLANEMNTKIEEWGLTGKIFIVVTDNASNIVGSVINILEWRHFRCYAHSLNLIVNKSLLPVEIILKKVKTTVTFF